MNEPALKYDLEWSMVHPEILDNCLSTNSGGRFLNSVPTFNLSAVSDMFSINCKHLSFVFILTPV